MATSYEAHVVRNAIYSGATWHDAGDEVTFTAQRTAVLDRSVYRVGDEVTVKLYKDWREDDGEGDGGPWGWGGYTTATLKRIGQRIR